MCTHVKCGLMGLQRCKCESVCTVGSQVASREVAHRPDRHRGMLFLCGGRPLGPLFRNLAEGLLLLLHNTFL